MIVLAIQSFMRSPADTVAIAAVKKISMNHT